MMQLESVRKTNCGAKKDLALPVENGGSYQGGPAGSGVQEL